MATTSSKKGRNSKGCQTYRLQERRERSKLRNLLKHRVRHPRDIRFALPAIEKLRKQISTIYLRQDGTAG